MTLLMAMQQGWFKDIFNILPILVFFAILYFLVLRPQVKQQKAHQKLVDNLKKGDKVITSGGLWGEVDSIEPQFVRIRIAEKTKVIVNRSAITGFQPASNDVQQSS